MSMEFVHDLNGIVDDFFDELELLSAEIPLLLKDVFRTNKFGELLPPDSDADEDGNLWCVLCDFYRDEFLS
jgi:hypothetical protein